VVLVNLDPTIGSEQGKTRPALITQNDVGNEYSPVTIIAPIISKVYDKQFPTNVKIKSKAAGLDTESTILLNQIRTIDKRRIIKALGRLDSVDLFKVHAAIKVSLGLS